MDYEDLNEEYIQDDFEEVIELDCNRNQDVADEEDDSQTNEIVPEVLENENIVDQSILSFEEHHQSVFCCDVSHDDKFAVTGGQDDRAIIWDTNTTQIKFQTTGHKDSIVAAKFNKNSTMVATGDMNGFIFVWNIDGTQLYDFEVDHLNWLLWHPVLENVLLAGTQGAWMWRLSKSNLQCKVFQSFGCNNLIARIFNDGKRIVMGYEDGSIRIWDLKETKVITAITGYQAHTSSVISLDINSDNTLVASGSDDSTVKILNVNSQKILTTFKLEISDNNTTEESIESLAFSAQNCLVVGSLNGYIQVWHIPTQTKRNEVKFPNGVSKIMVDKHNANIVYTGGLDAVFRVIDLRTCKVLMEKTGHQDHILDFCISSNSKYVLTCSEDSTCKIFKLE